jgi:hypothetical protein
MPGLTEASHHFLPGDRRKCAPTFCNHGPGVYVDKILGLSAVVYNVLATLQLSKKPLRAASTRLAAFC